MGVLERVARVSNRAIGTLTSAVERLSSVAHLRAPVQASAEKPTLRWVRAGRSAVQARLRVGLLAAAVALSLAMNAVLMLPLVPARQLAGTPIVAINYDAGETLGWPEFTRTLAGVAAALPGAERATAAQAPPPRRARARRLGGPAQA